MLVDDIRSLHHGVTRRDRAVGLDLEHEAIVVGVLAHAARLNQLGAATHGREERVNMDDADRVVIALVVLVGDVAAAVADAHAHGEVTALGEGGDVVVGVHELKAGRDEEVRARHLAGSVDRDGRLALLDGILSLEHQALHVQDDVGNILDHVGDGGELMLGAIDLNRLNGSALERGQQHAAQRVTERVAVAALERLDGNARGGLVDLLDLNLRPNEF